jgi:hypothetical protein
MEPEAEEDDDPDFALRELERVEQDERLAHALVLAEARAQLRETVVEQFDGDFARFLNGLSDAQAAEPPALLQAMYVIEKWSRVEMTVNDVGDSVCVAVLLPGLINVSVDTEGHNSVIVQAERRVFGLHDGEAIAALEGGNGASTSEYNAEYTFDGAQTAISKKTIEFEYSSSTGVLFVFIDQLRLRRQRPKSESGAKASAEAAPRAAEAKSSPPPEAAESKRGRETASSDSSSSSKSQGVKSAEPRSFLMKVSNKVNSMLKLKF